MNNNERIKALEKDVKRLQEQVDELENACVEHEATIYQMVGKLYFVEDRVNQMYANLFKMPLQKSDAPTPR